MVMVGAAVVKLVNFPLNKMEGLGTLQQSINPLLRLV